MNHIEPGESYKPRVFGGVGTYITMNMDKL